MNKTTILTLGLAALLLILIVGVVSAAPLVTNPAVDWWVFSGGGAPASVGDIALNGSLGQSIIGTSSSTNYSLDAGYWLKGRYKTFMPLILKN
jgi:hypothetical protein